MSDVKSLLCHLNILLEDGSTADSTKASGKPARLNIGDGSLSPAFEAELLKLKTGDNHSFTLAPADAFGESNPDAIHHLDRSRFPADMTLEPVLSSVSPAPAAVKYPELSGR